MIFASAITIQFSRYKNQYPFFLKNKIKTIPNSVEPILLPKSADNSKIKYVFAGRFSYQKQPMLLIKAFLSFAFDRDDVELVMYGRGDLEKPMKKFITETKSSSLIKILGPKNNPEDFLKDARALCIPSMWEGFPNVLAEALSSGVPALGFRNCDGVADLIVDSVNGWTSYSDGTIEPLKKLLERSYIDLKAKTISSKNCQKSVEIFKKDIIAKKWEELIDSLV
jgi:glycosyltransferase involved in cell wall biosynthesis